MWENIRRIKKEVDFKNKYIMFYVFVNLFSTLLSLAIPKLTALFIDSAIPQRSYYLLAYIALGQLIAIALTCITQVFSMYFGEKIALTIIKNGKIQIFNKIIKMPLNDYSNYSSSDLISVLNNDIVKYVNFMKNTVVGFVCNIITLMIVLVAIFLTNWVVGIIAVVLVPFFAISFQVNSKKLTRINKMVTDRNVEMGTKVYEKINNKMYIEASGKRQAEINDYVNELESVQQLTLRETSIRILPVVLSMIISSMIVFFVYLFGSIFAIKGNLSPGSIVAISSWITMTGSPVNSIALTILNYKTTLRSIERSNAIFEMKVKEESDKKRINRLESIVLKNVSFAYNDEKKAINNVSLSIKKGMHLSIIGANGSGKSTLIKLLLGLYVNYEGDILYNECELKNLDIDDLRNHIAYVPQNIILWRKTVLENIIYLRSKEEVNYNLIFDLIKIVKLDALFPNKESLDVVIGDSGVDFSGGERQKLALLRTLYANPDLLILDEATSNIDIVSEDYFLSTLKEVLPETMVISITHRLTNLQKSDGIALFNGGKMSYFNRFDELKADSQYNTYCRMLEENKDGQ